jgi:multiple sugar transport system permease protein
MDAQAKSVTVGADTAAPPADLPPRGRSRRSSEGRSGWAMMTPALILILLFLITPFTMAFVLGFTNQRLISPEPTAFVGLDNYRSLLAVNVLTLDAVTDETTGEPAVGEDGELIFPASRDFTRDADVYPQYSGMGEWFTITSGDTRYVILSGDPIFMRSLINTFIFALIIAPVQGGLGLALALLVNKRVRGVNVFRTIYFVPVVMSMVVVSVLWFFIYNPRQGLLNETLSTLTLGVWQPIDWLGSPSTALPSIIILSVWQGVGFNMMIWLAGLQTIDPTLYEAADIDGATRSQAFRHVTWPGLRNTAVFILITITIAAFGLFTQVDVMTQGGPLDSTTTVVYQAVRTGFRQQNIAMGSAISVVFFFMVLAVALIQRRLTREAD